MIKHILIAFSFVGAVAKLSDEEKLLRDLAEMNEGPKKSVQVDDPEDEKRMNRVGIHSLDKSGQRRKMIEARRREKIMLEAISDADIINI